MKNQTISHQLTEQPSPLVNRQQPLAYPDALDIAVPHEVVGR